MALSFITKGRRQMAMHGPRPAAGTAGRIARREHIGGPKYATEGGCVNLRSKVRACASKRAASEVDVKGGRARTAAGRKDHSILMMI